MQGHSLKHITHVVLTYVLSTYNKASNSVVTVSVSMF